MKTDVHHSDDHRSDCDDHLMQKDCCNILALFQSHIAGSKQVASFILHQG